ncbi:PKD domain-containing protein [Candidatus Kaiserbacteria bacterium]|nr:PKD domain-containing protein [Candidatus Kaiserbacteria bacterium]
MTSVTALLLQAAISLLLFVQAHPSLDASLREQAIEVANQAIRVATEQPTVKHDTPLPKVAPTANLPTEKAETENEPPRFTSIPQTPTNVIAGQAVTFSWKGTDPDGDNVGWSLDWGNGKSSTICVPENTAFTQSHTWNTPGTYTVEMTVSDCKGGIGIASFTVVVAGSAASVKVVSPDGGETFTQGDTLLLKVDLRSSKSRGSLQLMLSEELAGGKPSDPAYHLLTLDISPSTAGSIIEKNAVLGSDIVPGKYFVYAFWKSGDGMEIKSDFSNTPFSITASSSGGNEGGGGSGSGSGDSSGGGGGSSSGGGASSGSGGGGSTSSQSGF